MFGLGKKNLPEKEFLSFFPMAVCVIDNAKTVIRTNKLFEDLTGYREGDSIVEAAPSDILSGNLKEKTFDLKTKERVSIPVKAFIYKNILGLISVSEAEKIFKGLEEETEGRIKDLKETEKTVLDTLKTIKKEKEKNISIIENLRDGLFCINHKREIYILNPEAEKIMEVKREEVIGKHIFSLNKFDNFKKIVPFLNQTYKKEEKKEVRIKNKIFEFSFIPMKKGGKLPGVLVLFHDITREKAVEKSKSDFITLAAHQLRTPSSAIKWSLTALLDEDMGKISEPQRELLEKTHKAADRMIYLVNNLLNVDRVEERKHFDKTSLVDIEKITLEIVKEREKEIEEKKLKVNVEKKEKIPEVMADVERIKLVITNLLDNAIRYTPEKGEIWITIKSNKEDLLFSITDTGLGIPKNQKAKIFTKFFRADNVIKIDTEGSGIGLYMAKNIIETHNGKIWFRSEEGKGTTFFFTLPVKKRFSEYLTEDFY